MDVKHHVYLLTGVGEVEVGPGRRLGERWKLGGGAGGRRERGERGGSRGGWRGWLGRQGGLSTMLPTSPENV